MKIKVGVFFGGKTVEHEVSIITALQAIENMNQEKYEVIPIYIAKDNKMYCGNGIGDIKRYTNLNELLQNSTQVTLVQRGEKVGGVQECFFSTYEGAEKAVEAVNSFFEENDPNPEWMKDYLKCVTPEYRYMLKFPLKPGDILLEDEEHYVANRIVAKIGPDSSEVDYQGHDDRSYTSGREVHTEHQYSGIKDQYQIVRLVAKEQIIIDV